MTAHTDDSWDAPPQQPQPPQGGYQQPPGQQPQQQQGGYPQQGYDPNYPPQHQQGPHGGQAPAKTETNLFAILSLIGSGIGLLGILPIIGSIAGIVLGIIARKELEQRPEQGGKALADWGLILGIVGIVFWAFIAVIVAIFAAIFGGGMWWWFWN